MTLKDLLEEVKNYGEADKKDNKTYLIIGAVIVVFLLYWFMCRDNGPGINLFREQLNSAGTQQSEITRGINNAKSGIENAERATDNLRTEINESGAIIKDCQRIIKAVRERDEIQKQKIKDAT